MITFEEVFTFDHLLEAYTVCRRGKKYREATVAFHLNYLKNLSKLHNQLVSGTYKMNSLYKFTIYEPKKRTIVANRIVDKIVQYCVCKYALKIVLSPKMIYDNYASQDNKGNLVAVNRAVRYTRIFAKEHNWDVSNGWVVCCDISKFFYSIDKTLLKQMVSKLDIDKRLQELVHMNIDSFIPEYNDYSDDPNRGICIGFQTSQWLAVYYMNSLDHYIKEVLRKKYYGRYMDDFYIICESREDAVETLRKVNVFVENKLHLTLNPKSHIQPLSQGICFLGYHVTYNPVTHDVDTKIRNKSIKRMKKRLKTHAKMIKTGRMDVDVAMMSLNSWQAYSKHGETERSLNAYNDALTELTRLKNRNKNPETEMIDPDGFTILDYTGIDSDGFIKLVRRQETVSEYEARIHEEEVVNNWQKYANKNYNRLTSQYSKKGKKKKNKEKSLSKKAKLGIENMDKTGRKLILDTQKYSDDEGFYNLIKA